MTLDAERGRLTEAVVRVTERTLFAFAEPAAAPLPPVTDGWYAASVSFKGPCAGEMQLSVPRALARELREASIGEAAADHEHDVRDLVGEFANMVCGSWLTMCAAPTCFVLARPEVTRCDPAGEPALAFLVNDQPVLVSLHCHAVSEAHA